MVTIVTNMNVKILFNWRNTYKQHCPACSGTDMVQNRVERQQVSQVGGAINQWKWYHQSQKPLAETRANNIDRSFTVWMRLGTKMEDDAFAVGVLLCNELDNNNNWVKLAMNVVHGCSVFIVDVASCDGCFIAIEIQERHTTLHIISYVFTKIATDLSEYWIR